MAAQTKLPITFENGRIINYCPLARNAQKHGIRKIVGHYIKEVPNRFDPDRNERRTWWICLLRDKDARKYLLKEQILGFNWFFLAYALKVKRKNLERYEELAVDKDLLHIIAGKQDLK